MPEDEELAREHAEKLRLLRAAIDEGIRSLDAGEGEPLDIERFLRLMREAHEGS